MIAEKPRRFLRWGAALCIAFIVLSKSCEWLSEFWWFQAEGYTRPYAVLTAWRFASFFLAASGFGAWLTYTARLAWRTAASSSAPIGLRFREGAHGRLIPLEDKLGLDRYRRKATVVYIVCLSWAAGLAASARFDIWWRAFHARPTGQTDSLFQRDLAFFFWQLPALEALASFVSAALWAALLLGVAIYIYEEAVEIGGRRITASPVAVRHLGLLLGLVVAWKTVGWRVDALDLQSTSGWAGAEYTTHFGLAEKLYALPLYNALAVLSLPAAVLVAQLARRRRGRACLLAFSVCWLGAWLLGTLVPIWARTSPGVSLNHALRETLWQDHRQATLKSWRLDRVSTTLVSDEPAAPTPRVAALTPGQPVTDQKPTSPAQAAVEYTALWPEALAGAEVEKRLASRDLSLGNLQLEMWSVDGAPRPVYVAICESHHPGSIGGQTQYYGGIYVMDAVATAADGTALVYAAPGAPLKHKLRPAPQEKELTGTDFPLRFGEWAETGNPGPEAPERPGSPPPPPRAERSDSPLGAARDLIWTGGENGVSTHSPFRRTILALRFWKPGLLQSRSGRLVWHRRVAQRCRQIAPILDWGHSDPRLVWDGGKPVWTLTGYAWSRRYPNAAAPPSFSDGNYLRAVAVATVDAASGLTHMYALEPDEPYTALYLRALPGLLKERQLMPPSIARQLRASMPMMVGQSEIWAAFHPETANERGQRLQQLDGFFSSHWKLALQPPFAASRYDLSRHAIRTTQSALAGWPSGTPTGVLLSAFSLPPRQNDDTEEFPALKVAGFLIAENSLRGGAPQLRAIRYTTPRNIPAEWGRIRPVMIVEGRPLPPPPTQINLLPVDRWIVVTRATRTGGIVRLNRGPVLPPGGMAPTETTAANAARSNLDGTAPIGSDAPIRLTTKSTVLGPEGKPMAAPPTPEALKVEQRLQAARRAWKQARQAQQQGDWAGYTRSLEELEKALQSAADQSNEIPPPSPH